MNAFNNTAWKAAEPEAHTESEEAAPTRTSAAQAARTAVMPRIPLICPRCGRPQRVVPGGPERPARVVHADTGREACEPPESGSAPEPGHPQS